MGREWLLEQIEEVINLQIYIQDRLEQYKLSKFS